MDSGFKTGPPTFLRDPVVDGYIGCIVIRPDGSRHVAQVTPDPLAGQQKPD